MNDQGKNKWYFATSTRAGYAYMRHEFKTRRECRAAQKEWEDNGGWVCTTTRKI